MQEKCWVHRIASIGISQFGNKEWKIDIWDILTQRVNVFLWYWLTWVVLKMAIILIVFCCVYETWSMCRCNVVVCSLILHHVAVILMSQDTHRITSSDTWPVIPHALWRHDTQWSVLVANHRQLWAHFKGDSHVKSLLDIVSTPMYWRILILLYAFTYLHTPHRVYCSEFTSHEVLSIFCLLSFLSCNTNVSTYFSDIIMTNSQWCFSALYSDIMLWGFSRRKLHYMLCEEWM